VKESSAPAFIEGLMPALYNGYLYTIRPRHVLTLFAPDGHQVLTLPLTGNDTISILNVAIDSDTTLALSRRDEAGSAIELTMHSAICFNRSIQDGTFRCTLPSGKTIPSGA
jgi:hypothetical protein